MLSFKPAFSLSSFTFIRRLFSSPSLSAIRVVSSAYLKLLIFLLAILIPACASSSLAFHMKYSAYKLNKQGDNIQPWHTSFWIWNQSIVPCLVLTVASWPAYRFLKRQVRWSGIPISFRIFQFVVIHPVKGFGIVNKAEVDALMEKAMAPHSSTLAWKIPWTAAYQAPPSLGFSRQKHCSGLPFPSPVHASEKEWSHSVMSDVRWIIKKAREFQKNICFCFMDDTKALDYEDHNKLENSERDGNTRPPDLPSEKSVCRSRSNS